MYFFLQKWMCTIFFIKCSTSYKCFCVSIIKLSLWKENLNTEGQQFHHYIQNRQPSLTSTHKKKERKKTTTYNIGNPGPGLGQAHNCGIDKPIMDGLVVFFTIFLGGRVFCFISQYDIKLIMMLLIKTISSVLKVSAYIITSINIFTMSSSS